MIYALWGLAAAVVVVVIGGEVWRATQARIDRDIAAVNASIARDRSRSALDCPHLYLSLGTGAGLVCDYCGDHQPWPGTP